MTVRTDAPVNYWSLRQWHDWMAHEPTDRHERWFPDLRDRLAATFTPAEGERAKLIGDLRRLLEREEFTRDRVGYAGCHVRLEAADNVSTLETAIALLQEAP